MIGAMPWIGFAWDAGACFVGFEAVTVVVVTVVAVTVVVVTVVEAICAAYSCLGAAN